MTPQQYNSIVDRLNEWSALGRSQVPNGTVLIGHVPHIGPQAYLHEIFPGLTDAEIAGLEQTIGRPIPVAYREFLKLGNGISCFLEMTCYGLRRSYERSVDAARQPFHLRDSNVYERPRDALEDIVFIGGYTYDASKLYMRLNDERVYHCPRRTVSPTLNVWPDLYTWLSTEIDRLAKRFDKQGQLIDENTPTIPPADMIRADR